MLNSGDLEVILIDPDFTHFQGFTLPWIMRGWRTAQQAALTPSEQTLNGVHTITGTVTTIDTQRKKVLGDHFDTNYDALIVAVGARNNPGRVPGLAEAVDAGSRPPLLQHLRCGSGAPRANRFRRRQHRCTYSLITVSLPCGTLRGRDARP
ncbi:hypothetical protein IWGMT90018_26340 [Mycobacterium kiyosense]|nr:hypothetical protein IWGMT90018_26340 [Mycobacterium kiyosense]